MQFKYVVAAIASVAVSGALASPAPNDVEEMRSLVARADMEAHKAAMELGAQAANVNQQLFDKYGQVISDAYDHIKDQKDKIPTLEEMREMKKKIDELKQQKGVKRDALLGLNLGLDIDVDIDIGAQIGFNYPYGCQCAYPFYRYPDLYDFNFAQFYSCNGVYPTCGGYC